MLGFLDTPIRTRGGELARVLATRFPSVVAFETPGCGPCGDLQTALEALARDYIDRVRVVRVEDTDAETAARYQVRAVPTLVFWRQGHELNRIEGRAPVDAIRAHPPTS
jgi:thioredoxin-like negative regulator of GroEL